LVAGRGIACAEQQRTRGQHCQDEALAQASHHVTFLPSNRRSCAGSCGEALRAQCSPPALLVPLNAAFQACGAFLHRVRLATEPAAAVV
jgi:hypothetical protein